MMFRLFTALVLLVGLQACAAPSSLSAASTARDVADDRLLITLEPPPLPGIASVSASGRLSYSSADQQVRDAQLQRARELAAQFGMQMEEEWPIPALDVYCFVFRVQEEMLDEKLLAALAADARVESVQRMRFFTSESSQEKIDPLADWNHSLNQLLETAHQQSTGKNVSIAIIDAGVDVAHEDLDGSSLRGVDFIDGEVNMVAENHGTAVTGLLAARPGNGLGIRGLAPGADLLLLRACWEAEAGKDRAICNSFTLAKALSQALESESDIVNLSISGPRDPLLERLAAELVSRGQLIIAAGKSRDTFPGSITNSVLAADLASDSEAMLTLLPHDRYGMRRGSSIQAARVTGVAALARELQPGMTADEFLALLNNNETSTTPLQNIARLLQPTRKLLATPTPQRK